MTAPPRIIPLRYAASCVRCGAELAPKARASWNKERREATCESCLVDRGTPGASAARVALKRRERGADSRWIERWEIGARGERTLGEALELLRDEGFGVLHDRQIPGSRANIDHIVVGPAGVFVIDAKRYSGKIERRDRGWILRRDWRLYVGGRDRTKLLEGMPRQLDAVRVALCSTEWPNCRLIPVLCFVESHWGILAPPLVFDDVRVLWPKMLGKLLRNEGPLEREDIAKLERQLAIALPAA